MIKRLIPVGLFVGVGYGLCGRSLGAHAILLGVDTVLVIIAFFALRTKMNKHDVEAVTMFNPEDLTYPIGLVPWFDGLRPSFVITVPNMPVCAANTLWLGRDPLGAGLPA